MRQSKIPIFAASAAMRQPRLTFTQILLRLFLRFVQADGCYSISEVVG